MSGKRCTPWAAASSGRSIPPTSVAPEAGTSSARMRPIRPAMPAIPMRVVMSGILRAALRPVQRR